ncbi:uncharacterized protein N7469_006169 [Penicillium citrinum]|uniref:Uncharacterized protein n=1 Tax=Penicillium citrinum TaxID=5077 RepID=A0A9W9NXR1_PENCI|nr:uncharacterized protein N7469_006169 [Penicillium citrinum]KAJ5231581.1 hypothetical protein N7469_006169 [Penicillium citrinum]
MSFQEKWRMTARQSRDPSNREDDAATTPGRPTAGLASIQPRYDNIVTTFEVAASIIQPNGFLWEHSRLATTLHPSSVLLHTSL